MQQEPAVAIGLDTDVLDEPTETGSDEALIEDELLVEEISIDGMCGVY